MADEEHLIEEGGHPFVVTAHLVFKILPCALYLVLRWFIEGFSSNSCGGFCSGVSFCVIFLLAVDFWVTKNVSGRFLAGLRWWNQIRENGSERWIFESNEGRKKYPASQTMLFWGSLFAATFFWGLFSLFALLSLAPTDFFITIMGTILNGCNLVGFIKCARKARAEVQQQIQGYVVSTAMSSNVTEDSDEDSDESDDD